MEVYLENHSRSSSSTTDLEIKVYEGKLQIYMDDHCDYVCGYFRSKEDIIKVRDELNKYLEYVENG